MVTNNFPKKISIWFFLLFFLLSFYDNLLDLALWLLHTLFGLFHGIFEFTEHALDSLIEIIFQTDPRTTEIIVFYLMSAFAGFILFRLLKAIPVWFSRFSEYLHDLWHHEKEKAISYWQKQPPVEKFKFGSLLTASTAIMFLWFLN